MSLKVLFIASNPPDEQSLNLEREITELQRRFSEAPGEPVDFAFLPGLHVEDLPGELAKRQPDILHISAHGQTEQLSLSNQAGDRVALSARALAAFLPLERPPRLVYLNACNSEGIAEILSNRVAIAIGTTAPITNRAARAGAVAFYERILSGSSVADAFGVVEQMIPMMQDQLAGSKLYPRLGIDPSNEILHRVPRLIADFVSGDPTPKRGEYSVIFGVVGCPANTTQVVFFTDDASFIGEEEDDTLEDDLATIIRGTPVRGVLWTDEDDCWEIEGDLRLFAVGVTGDGKTFSVASTLCDAIETRYKLASRRDIPEDIAAATRQLKQKDGGELDYHPARLERQRAALDRLSKSEVGRSDKKVS